MLDLDKGKAGLIERRRRGGFDTKLTQGKLIVSLTNRKRVGAIGGDPQWIGVALQGADGGKPGDIATSGRVRPQLERNFELASVLLDRAPIHYGLAGRNHQPHGGFPWAGTGFGNPDPSDQGTRGNGGCYEF